MTYPLKFRQKVFAVKEKYGLTFEQTSERFDVPYSGPRNQDNSLNYSY